MTAPNLLLVGVAAATASTVLSAPTTLSVRGITNSSEAIITQSSTVSPSSSSTSQAVKSLNEYCSSQREQVNKLVSELPKRLKGGSFESIKALEAHGSLAECCIKEAKKLIKENGTEIKNISNEPNLELIVNLLIEVFLHAHHTGKSEKKARKLLKEIIQSHPTKVDVQNIERLLGLSSEANLNENLMTHNSPAKKIWRTGFNGSFIPEEMPVTETKFRFIPAKNESTENLLIVAPGRGEPMVRYKEMVMEMHNSTIATLVLGFQGNGDFGDPGHLDDFEYYTKSVEYAVKYAKNLTKIEFAHINVLGHSTGGHGVADALDAGMLNNVSQTILVSPLLGLNLPWYQTKGVRMLNFGLAKAQGVRNWLGSWLGADKVEWTKMRIAHKEDYFDSGFENNTVTQSSRRFLQCQKDGNRTHQEPPTLKWVAEAAASVANAGSFNKPSDAKTNITVFIASQDSVVDNAATHQWAEKVNASEVKIEGAMHALHMEADPYRQNMIETIIGLIQGNVIEAATNSTESTNALNFGNKTSVAPPTVRATSTPLNFTSQT